MRKLVVARRAIVARMTTLALTGWVMATIAHAASPRAAERSAPPSTTYRDAVLAYRNGDIDNAAAALAGWSADALRREAAQFVDRNHDWQLLAAAAMLHIDLILRGKVNKEAPHHIALAERIVGQMGTSAGTVSSQIAAFQARWYALAGSIYLARTDPARASAYFGRGLRLFQDNARLHMLVGSANELRSHIPGGGGVTLKDVERSYAQALALDPTLDEARLRLGRIKYLDGDTKAARVSLEPVARGSSLPRIRYLAHLFLGAVDESEKDFALARVEYGAALALCSQCQTAYVAVTFIEQSLGHDQPARDLMARYAVLPEAAADPWLWYQNGGLDEESLVWLRQQVHGQQVDR